MSWFLTWYQLTINLCSRHRGFSVLHKYQVVFFSKNLPMMSFLLILSQCSPGTPIYPLKFSLLWHLEVYVRTHRVTMVHCNRQRNKKDSGACKLDDPSMSGPESTKQMDIKEETWTWQFHHYRNGSASKWESEILPWLFRYSCRI